MTTSNANYVKNTDVTEKDLICRCGQELEILHVSNWHDGSGIFYTRCLVCGNETNVRWHNKK